jgi:hypothetical protein
MEVSAVIINQTKKKNGEHDSPQEETKLITLSTVEPQQRT